MLSVLFALTGVDAQQGCIQFFYRCSIGRRRQDDDSEMLDLAKAYRPGQMVESGKPERWWLDDPSQYTRTTGPYGKLDESDWRKHLNKDGMIPVHLQPSNYSPVCADMGPKWAANVAHATHSLTLEDLQFHFNPRTTWENKIPTLARDAIRILDNAPEHVYPAGAPFRNPLLNKLAYHMEQKEKDRGVPGKWNAFGVMIHVLHMSESHYAVREHYRRVHPTDVTCACLLKNEEAVRKELLQLGKDIADEGVVKRTTHFSDEWKVYPETLEQVRRDGAYMDRTVDLYKDAAMWLKCKLRHF